MLLYHRERNRRRVASVQAEESGDELNVVIVVAADERQVGMIEDVCEESSERWNPYCRIGNDKFCAFARNGALIGHQ